MCGTLQFSDNREKPEYFYLEIDHNTQSFIQKLFFFFSLCLASSMGSRIRRNNLEVLWGRNNVKAHTQQCKRKEEEKDRFRHR